MCGDNGIDWQIFKKKQNRKVFTTDELVFNRHSFNLLFITAPPLLSKTRVIQIAILYNWL